MSQTYVLIGDVVTIQIQLHVGVGEEGPQSIALPRASNAVKTALSNGYPGTR